MTYQCEFCGGIFLSDRPDEEARQEAAELFPGLPPADQEIACHRCFLRLVAEEDRPFGGMLRAKLPTHCGDCGAPLQGGATEHKEDCPWLKLIKSQFPGYKGAE